MSRALQIFVFWIAVSPLKADAAEDLRDLVLQLTAEIKALKVEVAQSKARIGELEQKLLPSANDSAQRPAPDATAAAASATVGTAPGQAVQKKEAVYAGDVKGSFKVPPSDTSIGFGGYTKLDVLYSSTGVGADKLGNQRLEVAEIPLAPLAAGNQDQIAIHAKESRFWVKSFTPSRWGDVQTYLELDFFGDAAAYTYTPRLRHAYGMLGNLLAGQTWTTFLNSQALADTLDNSNSAGSLLLLRQPQIRWTQPFSVAELPLQWQLALEAPKTRVWNGVSQSLTTVSASHYPDIVGRINFLPDWGNLSIAALARHLQFSPSMLHSEKTAWGGAVSVAGKINTWDSDNIRFMLAYGNGLGRYAVNNFFADAAVDADGEMVPVVSYNGMLAYQHWWTQAWRSTLAYGFARAEQPDFASGANLQTHSLHANLLWSPTLATTIGLEYIYASRELANGLNGELQRVQFSTRFNF